MTTYNVEPLYKIEKNVPLPTLVRRNIYGFNQMSVGDSFFIPATGKVAIGRAQRKVLHAAQVSGNKRRPARKYTTRTATDGVRVWRTK